MDRYAVDRYRINSRHSRHSSVTSLRYEPKQRDFRTYIESDLDEMAQTSIDIKTSSAPGVDFAGGIPLVLDW